MCNSYLVKKKSVVCVFSISVHERGRREQGEAGGCEGFAGGFVWLYSQMYNASAAFVSRLCQDLYGECCGGDGTAAGIGRRQKFLQCWGRELGCELHLFCCPKFTSCLGSSVTKGLLFISSFIFDCSDEVLLHCVVLGMLQLEKSFS